MDRRTIHETLTLKLDTGCPGRRFIQTWQGDCIPSENKKGVVLAASTTPFFEITSWAGNRSGSGLLAG